jgi:hypothetical protein
MIRTLFTLFAVGLVTVIGVGIVLTILSVAFSITLGIAGVLLTKVAPILLVGWGVLWLLGRNRRNRDELSAADRQWLEGG